VQNLLVKYLSFTFLRSQIILIAFVEKINVPSQRIDVDLEKKLLVNQDFVLITPTYGGGGDDDEGSVPIQVKKFLNEKK
jgi:protein involved in ribonucleotide reduction